MEKGTKHKFVTKICLAEVRKYLEGSVQFIPFGLLK